jgi:hypothetical protein
MCRLERSKAESRDLVKSRDFSAAFLGLRLVTSVEMTKSLWSTNQDDVRVRYLL